MEYVEQVEAIKALLTPAMGGIVLALWVIGFLLKKTPKVENWVIYWVILALGVVGGVIASGANIAGVVQGVLAAAVAVLGHQATKNTPTN